MAFTSQSSFVDLLANPKESLDIEIKGWLDLSASRDKATLAKAALALANHGGGLIILGLSEEMVDTFQKRILIVRITQT